MEDSAGWLCQPFGELSGEDVYDILRLRGEVFVVEQACIYLDPDGLDLLAWHWIYREKGQLLAHQRCLPPGSSYQESSIGRVVVAASARGRDLGRELVERGIAFNFQQWPQAAIRIGAQAHLQPLYESLYFQPCSEVYLEDGIAHIEMRLERPGKRSAASSTARE